jgi:hypothetical protein
MQEPDCDYIKGIRRLSISSDYHLLKALKQNLGGHKFKENREV